MREREKIMLIGIGELGSIILQNLCKTTGICEIVTADSDAERGFRETNCVIEGASYLDLYPSVKFQHIDLHNTDQVAELLSKIDPTIIFNATTLQSWWVVNELPPEINAKLYRDKCGLGPWVAMHLTLTHKLMEAVRMSGIDTYVINSSFPDAVNPSLARVGLAPTTGAGNIDLVIPYIKKAASELLNIPMRNINVEMIGHHYHCYNWCRTGKGYEVPHYLKVYFGNEEVTDRLGDMREFITQLPKRGMRPAGRHGQALVADSSVKNIMAIYNDSGELTHVPGPQGLEGGYRVRLSRRGAEVVPPNGITIEEAREINLQAQQYDGIQEIRDNGDIVVTEEAHMTFKEMMNVDCKVITIEDSFEQATELKQKFREFVKRNGINL